MIGVVVSCHSMTIIYLWGSHMTVVCSLVSTRISLNYFWALFASMLWWALPYRWDGTTGALHKSLASSLVMSQTGLFHSRLINLKVHAVFAWLLVKYTFGTAQSTNMDPDIIRALNPTNRHYRLPPVVRSRLQQTLVLVLQYQTRPTGHQPSGSHQTLHWLSTFLNQPQASCASHLSSLLWTMLLPQIQLPVG